MRKSRFTEEQIISVLAERERDLETATTCRRRGIENPDAGEIGDEKLVTLHNKEKLVTLHNKGTIRDGK